MKSGGLRPDAGLGHYKTLRLLPISYRFSNVRQAPTIRDRGILFGMGHPYGYLAPSADVLSRAAAQRKLKRLFQQERAVLAVVATVTPPSPAKATPARR